MSRLGSMGFVVNPRAGRRKAHIWRVEIESVLGRAGIRHDIAETRNEEEVEDVVRQFSKDHEAVFAVGGDGTAHHVAQGLAGTPTAFGLLPNGSGNDFSRMLGMPRGVRSGLELLLRGSIEESRNALQLIVQEADRGKVITRWGFNTAGFGFDAAVSDMKTRIPVLRGLALYLASSFVTLAIYKAASFSTNVPGDSSFRGLMVAAGVGEFEGGGFRIFPGASGTADTFQSCEIRVDSKLRALPLLVKAVSGAHVGASGVEMRELEEVVWSSDVPLPVHADGEVLTLRAREVRVRLVRGALRVVVPITEQPA